MKPVDKPPLYSTQAVRVVVLFLTTGIIATCLSTAAAATEDDMRFRIFKDGQKIIGGIFSLHDYRFVI